jgi:hypothetical protein
VSDSRCFGAIVALALVVTSCTSTPPTPTLAQTTNPSMATPATAASPSPGASASTLAPTPAVSSGPFPSTVLGMPVHTVGQMDALIGAGKLNGRVVAVAGYWSVLFPSCPYLPHQSVLTGFCTGISFDDVSGAPSMGIGDPDVILPNEATSGTELYGAQTQTTPASVVVLGHSDDSRAWQCTAETRAECESKFVIDRVAWVNGRDLGIGSPSSQLSLADLRLTPEQAAAFAVKPGEQLLSAYPLRVTEMDRVDPRFMGVDARPAYEGGPANVVWYVRAASGDPDSDGVRDGVVRLVDDVIGEVVSEMPLAPATDYAPARLILDVGQHSRGNWDVNFRASASVNSGGQPIASGYLGADPVSVVAGSYDLYGFVTNQYGGDVGDAHCSSPITVAADENLAYAVTFTKSTCSWALSTSQF